MNHVTREDAVKFLRGELPAEQMLAVDDHLASCEECRHHYAPASPSTEATLTAQFGITHLTMDEVENFARDRAIPARTFTHLQSCAACKQEIAELKKTLAPVVIPMRSKPRSAWAIAAAVLLTAALSGWFFVQRQNESMFAKHDGPVPPEYQEQVAKGWRSASLQPPSALTMLRGKTGVLRGTSEPANPVVLNHPLGVIIRETNPVFSWIPDQTATAYSVAVYDTEFQKIAESGKITSTEWRTTTPLQRGVTYQWTLTVFRPTGELHVPQPPQPEARFQVLSSASYDRVMQLQKTYPGSHLLLGVVLAQEGLLDEAAAHLKALAEANPDSPQAKALYEAVSKLR